MMDGGRRTEEDHFIDPGGFAGRVQPAKSDLAPAIFSEHPSRRCQPLHYWLLGRPGAAGFAHVGLMPCMGYACGNQ